MIRTLIGLFFIGMATLMYSCNERDDSGKTPIIQDSLETVIPTWKALKIKPNDDYTSMHIVVGDASLYKASDEVKNKKATELTQLILRIYGKGNYLEKGIFTITADERDTALNPPDGINIPMDFEGMKKTMGQ